jgi:DNA helicase-2/ATP-dependent DNA helicase PcrA
MTPSTAEEVAEDTALLSEITPSPPATVQVGHPRGEIFLGRLRVFLEEFASAAIEEASDRATLEQDAVNIMTIHQAKGLEFPIVFVPCLVERRFPSSRMGREQPWYVPDDLFDKTRYQGREDDERRLLYVAMTRAREMLVLSWFGEYQGGQRAARSRFVEDLVRVAPRQHLKGAGQCRPPFRPRRSTGRPILETSFSELYTFNECPRRYYYRSICGFRPSLAPELGFGKLLHHLVAELARRAIDGNSVNVRDVKEILAAASYLPFAGHIARDRLFRAALRRVEGYVRHHGAELQRALAPEWPFEVPLGAARIAGRVDLVLRIAGGGKQDVEFVDFKTAASRPPSEHHRNQLRLYAEAARVLGWNPVQLSIHDLDADNGGRITVENDALAASDFRAELHSWVDRIVSGDFEPRRSRGRCDSCDFARLCGRR